MGRIRRAAFGDDKENGAVAATGARGSVFGGGGASSVRFSRPWDNANTGPPAKRASKENIDSTRFASLRVEHFVDANIASRAAIFENGFDDAAPRRVTELASKFESRSGENAAPIKSIAAEDIRPGSIVRPWPDSPLRESNAVSPKHHLAPGGRFSVKPATPEDSEGEEAGSDELVAMDAAIKTQLGRRSVKPLLMNAKPPPLVGLPIPDKNPARSPAPKPPVSPAPMRSPGPISPAHGGTIPASPAKPAAGPMRTPTATTPLTPSRRCSVRREPLASPASSSRGSLRCSVRAPPVRNSASHRDSRHSMRMTPGSASRQSKRMSSRNSMMDAGAAQIPRNFPEVPQSSFLAFDENRLSIAEQPIGVPTSISECPSPVDEPEVRESLDFSDPDTFDTFGSINMDEEGDKCSFAEFETPEKNIGALPGLSDSAASDKPIFPEMAPFVGAQSVSRRPTNASEEDDDGDVFDVPQDLMTGTGGGKALRELQCASVTAGNELAAQVRELASKQEANGRALARERISRAQGELELRSRFFRRWNTRYASIVDHAYFGAVLFLFRHDSKASRQGTIALKNSKMIVLADSTVRELDGFRKNGPPSLFELKTAQRKYVFACLDDEQRGYWLDNLTSYAS